MGQSPVNILYRASQPHRARIVGSWKYIQLIIKKTKDCKVYATNYTAAEFCLSGFPAKILESLILF